MNAGASTILIVDDEARNRRLLEALLAPEGYVTSSAANGEEALASVARSAPDLILLDIMMPGMDGYQVASLLKSNPATSNIPIIMVSAQTDRNARLAGLHAGAEEFLTKPVDRGELWLRVRNLLRLKSLGDLFQNHSAILEQQVQARTADLQRFRTAMDATRDAIFLVSRANMRILEVNTTACNMLGYTREELLQLGPHQVAAATLEQLECSYDALIENEGRENSAEVQMLRKDGTQLLVEEHRQALSSGADWTIVGVMRDITERKEAEKRLHHLAHYDALTGLPNRTLFHETLKNAVARGATGGWLIAVLCIDVDCFKNVNDTLGHAIGDELLVQFGNRLSKCVRIRDTVGRMGGDEFAMIVLMEGAKEGAARIADKVREALREPFDLKGHAVTVTASIGITIFPGDASDPEILMRYADTAMYRAKQAGRDTFRFFTAQMNTEVLARLDLEAALRKAVENEEFVLHYQPKVQLGSGRIAGLEALLRWQRPGHGLVAPKDFLPILEETGLILRVGTWVIAQVCRQIGLWMRSSIGPIQVSVNVSGRQFIEGDLGASVIKAIGEGATAAELLELELTETSLMANTERTIATMQGLKKRGVHISIDDFGTGYSSLAYLRRFPIDKLKIDIAFVREITSNPDDTAIALAIIRMAHSLKLEVIAEGVETAAQLAYLRRHGCDLIQGFYFSPPLAVSEIERLLRQDKRLPPPAETDRVQRNTLLLVDDDEGILAAVQTLLVQDGYHILSARSAAEGFELLALHRVQVILCDRRMPTMSGLEFLDRVKDLYPDTFRIVFSGDSDPESIMAAINRGAIHRFYTKSWDHKGLRGNVRDAFRHYRLLHDVAPEEPGSELAAVAAVSIAAPFATPAARRRTPRAHRRASRTKPRTGPSR